MNNYLPQELFTMPSFRASPRYQALTLAKQRHIPKFKTSITTSNCDLFGCDTFNFQQMKKTLPLADIKVLKQYSTTGKTISLDLANRVAIAVKQWAIAKGATHYTHWFQPQTESTAEKHDSFLDFDHQGSPIDRFNGELLVRQEPDASSFPSGGRRETFEARGYTIWDASSFMFIISTKNGKILTIPSLFISYSGEALDAKTPLLRSVRALNQQACKALELLQQPSDFVNVNCGPEQEFFVIDSALHNLRPDLVLTGRTVLGAPPQKGQQLDDHYFGPIKSRVINMMMEVEHELVKLGVPIKTRHNEVAPAQYEMAPIYESANLASDHNRLLMAILRKVSHKHNLSVLFHEKPFADLNGTGKHLNWSLANSQGENLLHPGENPQDNLRFLYFLAAIMKGIYDNGDLIRASVAVPGNDFRMGANEAPPAIMSVYLGETLSKIVDAIISKKTNTKSSSDFQDKTSYPSDNYLQNDDSTPTINLDLAKVPVIRKDNTDRNRTSPFAFTGNKFEFRALGGSQAISIPITYLNAVIAKALSEMNVQFESHLSNGLSHQQAAFEVLSDAFSQSKAVHFDGNSYSDEWKIEAAKRSLSNYVNSPDALLVLTKPETIELFNDLGIMSGKQEIEARYNVFIDRYVKIRLIELSIAKEMINTQVIPAAVSYQKLLAQGLEGVEDVLEKFPNQQKNYFSDYVEKVDALFVAAKNLNHTIDHCNSLGEGFEAASYLAKEGLDALNKVRKLSDYFEQTVDDTLWSLPRYREILFCN